MYHNHSSVKISIYMQCPANMLNLTNYFLSRKFLSLYLWGLFIKHNKPSLTYRLHSLPRGPCWPCHFSSLVRFSFGCLTYLVQGISFYTETSLLKVWNLFTLNFLLNNSTSYPLNDSSNYINGKLWNLKTPKLYNQWIHFSPYLFSKRRFMQGKSLHWQYHCSIFELGFIQYTHWIPTSVWYNSRSFFLIFFCIIHLGSCFGFIHTLRDCKYFFFV